VSVSIPDRWAARAKVGAPGEVSEGMRGFLRQVARPFARVFHRATLEGTEHLPKTGPYLLVANHSSIGISEIACFAALYLEQVGADRPLSGVAHPIAFHLWPISVFMRHAGAVPSTRAACASALAAGIPILIFPGGDHEATRPIWQAYKVDFAGRVGFLKLARAAGVPIVPLGIRGSAFSMPILWRSKVLPWLLIVPRLAGTRRWPLTLLSAAGATAILAYLPASLPVRVAAAWAWAGSPLTLLPYVPSTIRMRIGPPIPPEALFEDGGDEALPRALARVEGAVRGLVDGLRTPRK
jgi:1-acyl-sn-glycerol-3-phosphate acyltransferase